MPFIGEEDTEFENYCSEMEKGSVWGGELEMKALANLLKFNIIIHQIDAKDITIVYHEPIGSVPTIHMSYHLRKHYNSVRRGDDPMEEGVSPLENYPIGHNTEKMKLEVDSSHDIVGELDESLI